MNKQKILVIASLLVLGYVIGLITSPIYGLFVAVGGLLIYGFLNIPRGQTPVRLEGSFIFHRDSDKINWEDGEESRNSFLRHVHPEDLESLEAAWLVALGSQQSKDVPFRIIESDIVLTLHGSVEPITKRQGKFSFALVDSEASTPTIQATATQSSPHSPLSESILYSAAWGLHNELTALQFNLSLASSDDPTVANKALDNISKLTEKFESMLYILVDTHDINTSNFLPNLQNSPVQEFIQSFYQESSTICRERDCSIKLGPVVEDSSIMHQDLIRYRRILLGLLEYLLHTAPEQGQVEINSRLQRGSLIITMYNNQAPLSQGEEQLLFSPADSKQAELDLQRHLIRIHLSHELLTNLQGEFYYDGSLSGKHGFTIELPLVYQELVTEITGF